MSGALDSGMDVVFEVAREYIERSVRRLFGLARRYGVQTVAELDELVRSGRIHEAKAFEDYFEFDHLQAERAVLLDSLKELM